MIKDGLYRSIDPDDRVWYAFVPIVSYLFEAAGGGDGHIAGHRSAQRLGHHRVGHYAVTRVTWSRCG
jgi:hypothetical protein